MVTHHGAWPQSPAWDQCKGPLIPSAAREQILLVYCPREWPAMNYCWISWGLGCSRAWAPITSIGTNAKVLSYLLRPENRHENGQQRTIFKFLEVLVALPVRNEVMRCGFVVSWNVVASVRWVPVFLSSTSSFMQTRKLMSWGWKTASSITIYLDCWTRVQAQECSPHLVMCPAWAQATQARAR